MLRKFTPEFLFFVAFLTFAPSTFAQANFAPPPSVPYGMAISAETAKKAAASAVTEARKNNWNMAIAIVDPAGLLVYFEKMDGTQNGSVEVSIEKARTAALFKRPSKVFQDAVAGGGEGWRLLRLTGAMPIEGGYPIMLDGKIIGAIGCSGGAGEQDSRVAKAGADSIK